MSVIQTIRNKYGKIAGGVIAVALIGFIVSDARNGSFGSFFGGKDTNIMKVDGVKIDPKEYNTEKTELEVLYTKGRTIDDAMRAQLDEEAMQRLIAETAIGKECDKLGIMTTKQEETELVYGPNVSREVAQFQYEGQQIFLNPQTGGFDPQRVKEFEKELAAQPEKVDPNGTYKKEWETIKTYVVRKNRVDKYRALFTTAAYEPTYMAKRTFGEQAARASIRYVKVPLTSVPDAEVKVTDDDINAFMQKRPGFFQVEQAQRTIEYVSFEIIPSSADTARALDALAEAKNEFATTKDNKAFVNNKSDEANSYSEAYVNKKIFQSRFADTILGQPTGSVYGPYYENGNYKITKVVDKKELPDSVKCRYILVRSKVNGNELLSDMAAKQRMDSAVAAVKGGAPFDSVVNRYSDDDKSKGGVNTFTLEQKTGLPKEFANFLFEGKKGETKIVRDSAANYVLYFYAEIMDQSGMSSAAQLATISKILAPSDSTVKAIYGKANDFAGKNATAAEFDAAIKKEGLDKRIGDQIKMNTFTITGLGPAREVVKWVYDNKVGDVSQVFQLGDQRYVVAKISSVQNKGLREITPLMRPRLEQLVRDEKKVAIIANKYKAETTVDAIGKMSNTSVQQNDSLMLSGTTALEPRVVGYAFSAALQPNAVSPGIKGENGVYFITVTSKTPPQTIDANNPGFKQIMDMQRARNEMQQQNVAAQMLQQAIVKKADVEYYYYNF